MGCVMLMPQAVVACTVFVLTILPSLYASSGLSQYGTQSSQQQPQITANNLRRYLLKELDSDGNLQHYPTADQWKLVRVEQLLDALSSSIPPPTVVLAGNSRSSSNQAASPGLNGFSLQEPAGKISHNGAEYGDGGSGDGRSSSHRTQQQSLSMETPEVGDAGSLDPNEPFFVPETRSASAALIDDTGLKGPMNRKSELAGIVFSNKGARPALFGPDRSTGGSSATPYRARNNGGAAMQRAGVDVPARNGLVSSLVPLPSGALVESRLEPSQQQQQQRRIASGSEEVAVHTPIHSQSSNDFEWKRVENTRWNNLRGMWGKRSVM